jgi:hypothetical protein
MKKLSRTVWLGIGAASLVGAAAVPQAEAQHGSHGAKTPPAAGKDSGQLAAPQGGEAYLTDGGPKDTRIRIYRDIELMRGHLRVGDELIEKGLWDEALPHFLHPTEELYAVMERYIKLHKVPPFGQHLKVLSQTVKAKNKAAYTPAAKVVQERLATALKSFQRFMGGKPMTSYTMQAIVETLKVAQSEYESAFENGKLSKPVEFQDSRGFTFVASDLLDAQAAALKKVDAAQFQELQRQIATMKAAWPSPVPPDAAIVPPAKLTEQVDAFAKAAERFF